jgi:N-acetylneuraminic acid mutarotase
MSGSSSTRNAVGVYGTLGVASISNVPGGREWAASWTDSSGNLWLFGGFGYDSTGISYGDLNDLWEFNPTNKQWAWMSGSNTVGTTHGQPGVYGTLGVAATSNVPGGRVGAVSWTDGSGNLWLFGGSGLDSNGDGAWLNDLWKFNPTNKQWIWMSGSETGGASGGQPGVYGTLGVAATSNVPGGRIGAISWTDRTGNLWLFGGTNAVSDGCFNDLWVFNPTNKEWTWVSGSSTANASGVYGTQGVPAAANVPGGRSSAISWIDSSGNVWLFGGNSVYSNGAQSGAYFNDLWEFNPTNKQWTWVSGSATINAPGIYGTLGAPASSNVPGSRNGAISWKDSSDNLWLFGGGGVASILGTYGYLNDLWQFSPTTKQWTWISGSNTVDIEGAIGQPGVYGTLGTPAPSNVPGNRFDSVSWIDSSGNLWLFGGAGVDSTGAASDLNDLWRYQP